MGIGVGFVGVCVVCFCSPGNLRWETERPVVARCSARSSVCVVFPDLSRPSMTMNAPRGIIVWFRWVLYNYNNRVHTIGYCMGTEGFAVAAAPPWD
jgi:hypothetical protein